MVVREVNRVGDRVFIHDFSVSGHPRYAMVWEVDEDTMYVRGSDEALIKDFIGMRNGLNYFGEDFRNHHQKKTANMNYQTANNPSMDYTPTPAEVAMA